MSSAKLTKKIGVTHIDIEAAQMARYTLTKCPDNNNDCKYICPLAN